LLPTCVLCHVNRSKEGTPGDEWRWCGPTSQLTLDNQAEHVRRATIEMAFATVSDSNLRIESPLFVWFDMILGFLSPFGDMTLWNILASCIVIPYISSYPCVTNLMLWRHILSVAPETSSIEGGDRFHLDTSHDRPDPFVARCDHPAPRGV
jgi:hypothetical protein